jgi:argininosuccinate lyase
VSGKLWGGNYSGDPDQAFWAFNRSLPFDRRLLREEIAASRAYVAALGRCGALPPADVAALDAGLAAVLAEAGDPAHIEGEDEDVHSFVESRLGAKVGALAGQAHLGRSRNEQAVTALRLWVRAAIDRLCDGLAALGSALVRQGLDGADAVMPGYTHTRAAEPITFGHLAGAHVWALVRDRNRMRDTRRRVNVLPLGSGALAGTALPLDRDALARDLRFDGVSRNALDAVSDRDFAAEFTFDCAQLQTHLARLAEELIWFSGPEYGFFTLPDAFTTGSSLMPQKKNPDALELVRGKAARVDADVVRLLALMKGLPAGYQKDLQEDKEAVFDAADTTLASVAIMTGVVSGLALDREAMRRAASNQEMLAAGLAVALARQGLPFRKAHEVVGGLVAESQRTGRSLRDVAGDRVPALAPALADQLDALFDPVQAVAAKAAPGGTAPDTVRASRRAALDALSG